MKLKKAIAELRSNWERWRLQQRLYGRDHNASIRVGSAIPVAETLLAALEGFPKREDSLVVCPYCKEKFDLYDIACSECKRNFRDWFESQGKIYWSSPPPADPTTLAGRTVDGWGWKVFRLEDGGLRSQIILDTKSEAESLPERTWLHYRDWQAPQNTRDQAWNILKTEADARAWITKRDDEGHRIIRRVAWRELANSAPSNIWPLSFEDRIFTAEQIYILPEEGVPAPPAERPPEKGDWLFVKINQYRGIEQVLSVKGSGIGARIETTGGSWGWTPDQFTIVRRAADPLRVGDKVSFGSKEGEVKIVSEMSQTCRVKFDKTDVGWFNRKDLTLVEPVFERDDK